jgi:hypothetical protein
MVDLEIRREIAADAWPRLGINTQKSGVRISNLFITLTSILSRTRERRNAPADAVGGQTAVSGGQITCR